MGIGNDGADAAANEGVEKPSPMLLNLMTPESFTSCSLKLSKVTQALVYKGILSARKPTERKLTVFMLEQVRLGVEEWNGTLPSYSKIWNSIRSKNIKRNAQNFLWCAVHDSYRLGRWWLNINGYERRAEFHDCDFFEDLEHILGNCSTSGQRTLGTTLDCRLSSYFSKNGKPKAG